MRLWPRSSAKTRAHQLERLDRAPDHVAWRYVRPKAGRPVRAELARSSGTIDTPRGALRFAAGKHYIVHYAPGDRAPVLRSIFDQTYRRRADGLHEKSTDIVLRYFTLPYPVMVASLEGEELAHAGDWIMQGKTGELWPIAAQDAKAKYEPVKA